MIFTNVYIFLRITKLITLVMCEIIKFYTLKCINCLYKIPSTRLELIKKILKFEIIKKASMFTKYGQNLLDTDFFTYVPDLRKLGYTDITEDEFNKLISI